MCHSPISGQAGSADCMDGFFCLNGIPRTLFFLGVRRVLGATRFLVAASHERFDLAASFCSRHCRRINRLQNANLHEETLFSLCLFVCLFPVANGPQVMTANLCVNQYMSKFYSHPLREGLFRRGARSVIEGRVRAGLRSLLMV